MKSNLWVIIGLMTALISPMQIIVNLSQGVKEPVLARTLTLPSFSKVEISE